MTVARDVMKTDIVSAQFDETVADVAQRMIDADVGAVLVLSGDSLMGIFSERDLLRRVVAEGKDAATTQVSDVTTHDPATVQADTHIRRCAEVLLDEGCRHLPVVEGNRPVGIISARDFFAHVANELERFINQDKYREQLEANIDPYDSIGGGYRE